MPQVALWGKGILCKKSAGNTNYSTHVWLYRLPSAEIALAHISCGFEVYIDTLRTTSELPLSLTSVTCNGKSLISKGKFSDGDLWLLKGIYFKKRKITITYKEGNVEKHNYYTFPAVEPVVNVNSTSSEEYFYITFDVEADEGFSEMGAIVGNDTIGKVRGGNSSLQSIYYTNKFSLKNLPWGTRYTCYGYAIYDGDTIMSSPNTASTKRPGSFIYRAGDNKPIIGTTSCTLTGKFRDLDQYVDSCGWEISDMENAWGTTQWTNKYIHKFADLVPGKHYFAYFIVDAKGSRFRSGVYDFYTESITFENKATDKISNTSVHITAKTNCDATKNVGFEWRKYDAPNLVPSSYSECPVVNGVISGTLNKLSPNTYYKYRPYYKDVKGEYYYGEWLAFGTSDAYAYFQPDVVTNPYSQDEQSIKLTGFVIAGSEDTKAQGFEYWATNDAANKSLVEADGQNIEITLTNLNPSTEYSYRAFATTSSETIYGDIFSFTTPAATGINQTPQSYENLQVLVKNKDGLKIAVSDKKQNVCVYSIWDIRGRLISKGKIIADGQWKAICQPTTGIYIIKISNGTENKIIKTSIK